MNIIDFRFRPNTPEIISGIKNSAMFKELCASIDFDSMQGQELDEIVTGMKKNRVTYAVITGRDCETTYGSKHNNDSVIQFVNAYPDMFFGFYGLDPHKGMDCLKDLTNAVNSIGMKGAAIDPYLARIYANDAKYYPIYAKCCELGVPVIITTGPASFVSNAVIDHVAPRYIDFVARDFPELTIVVSHGGYPWVNEMIMVAQRNRNVYFEFSEYETMPMSEYYVQAANEIIPDKILFASAHPFIDYRDQVRTYASLPFEDSVREQVMFGNAARILGITP